MGRREAIVLKLGGSVATFKDSPLIPNMGAIEDFSRCIGSLQLPLVLVHGGGSFGHYMAKIHGLDTHPRKVGPRGVAETRMAMLELDCIIIKSLHRFGVHPYVIPPSELVRGRKIGYRHRHRLTSLIKAGLTPVTFGDVLASKKGFYIISGDEIAREFSRILSPARVVFTMDVDGVYENGDPDRLIPEIVASAPSPLGSSERFFDVTGGIHMKVKMALEIARRGIDVCFVNGLKPDMLAKALKGEGFNGTLIRGARSGR